jgi:hypothetical protein
MSAAVILEGLACGRPGCPCQASARRGGGVTHCPSHDDPAPSLNLTEKDGRVLWHCHAGCPQDKVTEELRARGLLRGEGVHIPPNERATVQPPGCSLTEYAVAKSLPADFLRSLGLSEFRYMSSPAVRIPYLSPTGEELAVRFRVALAGDKFRWKSGARPCLYGLSRLDQARAAGYVLLVEGESDAQTAWHYGLPAVGLPGAGHWRDDRDAQHLEGLEVRVIVEPDSGGEALIESLSRSRLRDNVRLLRIDGAKDLSDLHLADPGHFIERLTAATEAAPSLLSILVQRANARRIALAAEAEDLAREPDILAVFARDLKALSVAGEERAAKLLYLIVTSRLLTRPGSAAVKGPSSAGKSYLVESVLRFFPASAYYGLTAMSERALAYSTEPLAHRHLVLYEAAGMSGDFASYLIRSLLSEGRLRYETVEKTRDGLVPKLIEREGPTGLIVTTTAINLHPENETRLLSIPVSDSADQTKAVLAALAAEATDAPDFARWHALQDWLATGDSRVTIPYAAELAAEVPPVAVRLRRDFGAILNLIRAHALLHQSTRARDGEGRIVATEPDYLAVRQLVHDLVADGVGSTVSPTIRETVGAVAKLTGESGGETTNAAVAQTLGLDRGAASRRVAAAVARGYILNREEKRGRPLRLVVGDPLPADIAILPERLHGCTVDGGDTPPSPPPPSPNGHISEVADVAAGRLQGVDSRYRWTCPTCGAHAWRRVDGRRWCIEGKHFVDDEVPA